MNEVVLKLVQKDIVVSIELIPNSPTTLSILRKFYNRYGRYNQSILRFEQFKNPLGVCQENHPDHILDFTNTDPNSHYRINIPYHFWLLHNTAPVDCIHISLLKGEKPISSKNVGVLNDDRVIASKIQIALHFQDLLISYFSRRVIYKAEYFQNQPTSSWLFGLWSRLKSIILSKLNRNSWKIKLHSNGQTIVYSPPTDNILWADPFLFEHHDRRYFFFEEQIEKYPATIQVIDLKSNSQRTAIAEPYHLSYPHIIRMDNNIYMIPESSQNRSLDIYKCVSFPDKWDKVHSVFSDRMLHDATILKCNGKYWLFAVSCSHPKMNPWVDLHIYYTENIFGKWKEHSMNPVLSDVRYARCGGAFFKNDESWIRVCQDSSGRYGRKISFRKIVELSEHDFREVPVESNFDISSKHTAIHTFNLLTKKTFVYDYID